MPESTPATAPKAVADALQASESDSQHEGQNGSSLADVVIKSLAPQNGAEDANIQDCDSEVLDALEDEAEDEDEDEAELDRLVDEAALEFPADRVVVMIKQLKQIGLVQFLALYAKDASSSSIQKLLIALGVLLPRSLRTSTVPHSVLLSLLKAALHRLIQRREKLTQYNSPEDVLTLLRNSSNTIVLSGAGISTACGLPDFRSKDGIYARLRDSGTYALDDPSDMFDKDIFTYTPEIFYSFAREIYPSNFTPSLSHRFIRLLEERGSLLRNYTQNIDTLEQAAGIHKVLNCHGSFATASCITCSYKTVGASIKDDIFAQRVPACPECAKRKRSGANASGSKKKRRVDGAAGSRRRGDSSDEDDDENDDGRRSSILKPDITFFGEKLSDDFDRCLLADRSSASLLLIIGTSLKVAPVSSVVGHLPHSCPVILINRTPVVHVGIDVMLLGDSDKVVRWLCRRLGWEIPPPKPDKSVVGDQSAAAAAAATDGEGGPAASQTEAASKDASQSSASNGAEDIPDDYEPQQLSDKFPHIWLFPGAEPGPLLQSLEEDEEGSDDESEGEEGAAGQEEESRPETAGEEAS